MNKNTTEIVEKWIVALDSEIPDVLSQYLAIEFWELTAMGGTFFVLSLFAAYHLIQMKKRYPHIDDLNDKEMFLSVISTIMLIVSVFLIPIILHSLFLLTYAPKVYLLKTLFNG